MADSEKIVGQISEKINDLQRSISQQPWRTASRIVFTNALEKSISEMQTLQGLFLETVEELEKDPKEGKPELRPFMEELGKLVTILEKNLRFERKKKTRGKTVNLLEQDETPELYADLEQRILGTLLKARYSLERMTIFMRRQGLTPLTGKGTAKQVMQILERKEDELQDLREKYEDVRKKSYLGYFEEETVADLEQDLGVLGRKMTLSADELSKSISFHRSQIEYIQNSYAELKQKLDTLEETFFAYSEKSEELIKDLKKERDYAKKVVLDVEHETLKLRNTYTSELLSMQESKLGAKQAADKKYLGEMKKLQKEVSSQRDLVKHFRKIAEEKLKKEHDLEEKVKRLTLLVKTKEKHETIKRKFKGKTSKAKKKGKKKK